MANTRNCFQVDIPEDDPDMEDLKALKKVKDAISKKKREIRERDWGNKHPKLAELVDHYRRRSIKAGEKNADGKIPLNLEVKPVAEDVKEMLDEKPKPKRKEPDLGSAVRSALSKQKDPEKAFNDSIVKSIPKPPANPFNPATGKFF